MERTATIAPVRVANTATMLAATATIAIVAIAMVIVTHSDIASERIVDGDDIAVFTTPYVILVQITDSDRVELVFHLSAIVVVNAADTAALFHDEPFTVRIGR